MNKLQKLKTKYNKDANPCGDCGGYGYSPLNYCSDLCAMKTKQGCHHCGKKQDDCKTCKGTGKQEEFELDGKNYNKYGKETKDGDYRKVTPVKQEPTLEERFDRIKRKWVSAYSRKMYPKKLSEILNSMKPFVDDEIALAVQQRDEEIIEIVKKMHGEHHEYINNSTIGLNAYRQAVIDIIKAINQHNE